MSNLTDALIAAKLIGAQGGGGRPSEGGVLICHVNNDTGEFDVTWQQIFDALSQGKRVMSVYTNRNSAMQIVLYIAKKNSNSYDIYDTTRTSGSTPIASCTSANAHPVYK